MAGSPHIALGFGIAGATLLIDQVHKWMMLGPFDIAAYQPVRVTPFLDLVLAWNRGVSYGWFSQDSDTGRYVLAGLPVLVSAVLWVWLTRTMRPLSAAAIGMVIGGALANGLDRIIHGAVADFFLFHAFGYSWYVFNLADVAIVVGVALLMYESWAEDRQPET